jgi:hypothetical protein
MYVAIIKFLENYYFSIDEGRYPSNGLELVFFLIILSLLSFSL